MDGMARETRTRGIVYAAMGDRYLQDVAVSIASARQNTDLPVCVYTNKPDAVDADVVIESPPIRARVRLGSQISALLLTPYDYTLMLDADTYVCRDVTPLFDILDTYDVATMRALQPQDHWFPTYSSGFILARKNEAVTAMLEHWRELYLSSDVWSNQRSLRRALFHAVSNGLQLFELASEVEFKLPNIQIVLDAPWVLHTGTEGRDRFELGPELCKQVSRGKEFCLYIPGDGRYRYKKGEWVRA